MPQFSHPAPLPPLSVSFSLDRGRTYEATPPVSAKPRNRSARRLAKYGLPAEHDALQQQAIADAVEGVLP